MITHFGWEIGPVTALSLAEFKAWLRDGDTTVQLGKLLRASLAKEFTQSASATSGITAYGSTPRKGKRKVRLVPGKALSKLVKRSR